MSWAMTKDLIGMARQYPSLATVLALLAIGAGAGWTYIVSSANAGDISTIQTEVAALTSDLKTVKTDLATVKSGGQESRRESLEAQLFGAKVSQCMAESTELRSLYAKRVSDLLVKYTAAGGKGYQLPDCDDL